MTLTDALATVHRAGRARRQAPGGPVIWRLAAVILGTFPEPVRSWAGAGLGVAVYLLVDCWWRAP